MGKKTKDEGIILVVKLFSLFPCIFHSIHFHTNAGLEKIFLFEIKPIHCSSGFKMQFSVFRNIKVSWCVTFSDFSISTWVHWNRLKNMQYCWDRIMFIEERYWLHYVRRSRFFFCSYSEMVFFCVTKLHIFS